VERGAPWGEWRSRAVPERDTPRVGGGTPVEDHGGLRSGQVHGLGDPVGEEGPHGEALGCTDSVAPKRAVEDYDWSRLVTVTGTLICEWCGNPFARESAKGPAPRYCSRSHRQRAYECRRQGRLTSDSAPDPQVDVIRTLGSQERVQATLGGSFKVDSALTKRLGGSTDVAKLLSDTYPSLERAAENVHNMIKINPAFTTRLSNAVEMAKIQATDMVKAAGLSTSFQAAMGANSLIKAAGATGLATDMVKAAGLSTSFQAAMGAKLAADLEGVIRPLAEGLTASFTAAIGSSPPFMSSVASAINLPSLMSEVAKNFNPSKLISTKDLLTTSRDLLTPAFVENLLSQIDADLLSQFTDGRESRESVDGVLSQVDTTTGDPRTERFIEAVYGIALLLFVHFILPGLLLVCSATAKDAMDAGKALVGCADALSQNRSIAGGALIYTAGSAVSGAVKVAKKRMAESEDKET
jgi:hypothetical protein